MEFDDSAGDPGFRPWTGHARYTPNYGSRGTTPDMWALELAPVASFNVGVESVRGRERQRFSLAGGEVVIYDCEQPWDARWAAWMGPWHMAHGMFYRPEWEVGDIVETFSRLRFTDTPEGMTADPVDRFSLEKSLYLLPVAGVGTLWVEPKEAAAKRIPRWRGFTAAAGEIWRLPEPPSSGAEPLLFVTDSAVATLMPWDVPAPAGVRTASRAGAGTAEGAFEFLNKVTRVDWKG